MPPGFEHAELENFLYADWALGALVREARSKPFFDDTLFVFVGDHGVHLRGRELIPIDENRVAALFFAPARPRAAPHRARDQPARRRAHADGDPRRRLREHVLRRGRAAADPQGEGFAPMVYDRKRIGLLRGPRFGVFLENGEELAFERGPAGAGFVPVALRPRERDEHRDGAALLQMAEIAAARRAATAARRPDPRQLAGRISKRSAPSARLTRTRPPFASGPKSTSSARRSLSSVWITRASGRAPKSGS